MIQEEYLLTMLYPDATAVDAKIKRQWYIRSSELLVPVRFAYSREEAWIKTWEAMVPDNVRKAMIDQERQRREAAKALEAIQEDLMKIRKLMVTGELAQRLSLAEREKIYQLTKLGDRDYETVHTRTVAAGPA